MKQPGKYCQWFIEHISLGITSVSVVLGKNKLRCLALGEVSFSQQKRERGESHFSLTSRRPLILILYSLSKHPHSMSCHLQHSLQGRHKTSPLLQGVHTWPANTTEGEIGEQTQVMKCYTDLGIKHWPPTPGLKEHTQTYSSSCLHMPLSLYLTQQGLVDCFVLCTHRNQRISLGRAEIKKSL